MTAQFSSMARRRTEPGSLFGSKTRPFVLEIQMRECSRYEPYTFNYEIIRTPKRNRNLKMSEIPREQLEDIDRHVVWHAFTQMAEYQPFIIERAEGCMLYDIDGNSYIDGTSTMWCNVHGHRHPTIDQAIRDQLDKVAHVTNLGMSNPTTIQLAKRLVDIAPEGLDHVFFSDSGATAIEVGLKMAFQYWQQCDQPRPEKTSYIALELAYHGDTIGSNSVGGIPRFHQVFGPLLFDVVRLPCPNKFRPPVGMNAESATSFYLEQLEQTLSLHHHRIAAMVLEPLVQAAAGMVMHPEGYLRGVPRTDQSLRCVSDRR